MDEYCGADLRLQLCSLPDSILLEIFSYLPVQSLGRIACVCSRFSKIVRDKLLWKDIFHRRFRVPRSRSIRPGAASWQEECQRLIDHTPKVLCEELTKHKDQVLHISFSHNGLMFATSSKDGKIMVWNVDRNCSLRFAYNMTKEFSWRYTQFSQFNRTDTLLLVSGVHYGNANTSGEIAVFDLQEFKPQCRVVNKPYDVFGTWYDNSHLLSGSLYWTGHLNSVSALWLNKANQALECERESVTMCLYRFQNVNASSIRTIMVAECPSENESSMPAQLSPLTCVVCSQEHLEGETKELLSTNIDQDRSNNNASQEACSQEDLHFLSSLREEDEGFKTGPLRKRMLHHEQWSGTDTGLKDGPDHSVDEDSDFLLKSEDTLIREWEKMEMDSTVEESQYVFPHCSSRAGDVYLDVKDDCFNKSLELEDADHLIKMVNDVHLPSHYPSACCDILLSLHGAGLDVHGAAAPGPSPRNKYCCRDSRQRKKSQGHHPQIAETAELSPSTSLEAPLSDTGTVSLDNHAGRMQCIRWKSEKTVPPALRDKLLIFTMGEETYTPHLIGIKRIHVEDVIGFKNSRENLISPDGEVRLLPDVDQNLQGLDRPKDSVDHVINMHGHIVGMALSPDHRYLYVNSRQWPQNYSIEKVLEPPPIAQEIDIHVIDLLTLKEVGTIMRSHKAFTPNDECFFLFLDVSEHYVASGAEDKHGYIWDRHYGICLNRFPHADVVNSVAFNPQDQEMLVTVSDDFKIKVWRSSHRMREMGLQPLNTMPLGKK